ncbi:MAG: hypothetical protein ACR2RV_23085 [Verrucomicrobiales bacterium]
MSSHGGPIPLEDDVAHSENFDSLINTGVIGGGSVPQDSEITAAFWGTDGSGWWNGSGTTFGSPSDGTSAANSARLISYGEHDFAERALGLGWRHEDGVNLSIGAQFQNSTGGTISTLDISYDGELWYHGAVAAVGDLTFDYSLNAASIRDTGATWSSVPGLDFTPPGQGVGEQFTPRDGNNSAQRVAGISGAISGLAIPPGATFFIRWSNSNSHGMGIDNFSITASTGDTPTVRNIAITDIVFDGADVTLIWDSSPGRLYAVQASKDLSANSWESFELDTEVESGGMSTMFTWPDGVVDPIVDPSTEDKLFFRAVDVGAAP